MDCRPFIISNDNFKDHIFNFKQIINDDPNNYLLTFNIAYKFFFLLSKYKVFKAVIVVYRNSSRISLNG